jgi:hypothetical protein
VCDDGHFLQPGTLGGTKPLGAEVDAVAAFPVDGVYDDGLQNAAWRMSSARSSRPWYRTPHGQDRNVLTTAGCRVKPGTAFTMPKTKVQADDSIKTPSERSPALR